MRIHELVSVAAVLSVLPACGGEPKPAASPETTAMTSDPAQTDMPSEPAPSASGDGAEAPTAAPAETPSLSIKIAAMKLVPAKKGKTLEVKDDGTITSDGKPVAKIAGDQVDATDGSGTLVTVGMDGSLVGQAVKPGFKLEGDELVTSDGVKLSVGDDGALTATSEDGKSETIAKVEGGADAKRTALVVAAALMIKDAPAAPKGKAKPKK